METPGATDNETPVDVTLTQGFWMAQTETTQSQWMAFEGADSRPWAGQPFVKEGPDYPASYIDYVSATAWCDKLTELERAAGRLPEIWRYALPTEAQWEYSARAGTNTPYSFEGGESQLRGFAWFDENANVIGEEFAHEVRRKKPNPWGLYDVHGNLRELCRDAYQSKLPGGQDPFVDSADQAAYRVFRGGSWFDSSVYCRSALRSGYPPTYRDYDLGFRPATVPVESGR